MYEKIIKKHSTSANIQILFVFHKAEECFRFFTFWVDASTVFNLFIFFFKYRAPVAGGYCKSEVSMEVNELETRAVVRLQNKTRQVTSAEGASR